MIRTILMFVLEFVTLVTLAAGCTFVAKVLNAQAVVCSREETRVWVSVEYDSVTNLPQVQTYQRVECVSWCAAKARSCTAW